MGRMIRCPSFTCQNERSGLLRYSLADGGVPAVFRDGLDEEAGDGLNLGPPGECDGGIPQVGHLHTAGRTKV